MSKVIVIGAGAAGMMAAYSAALNNHEVIIIEKNEKCGKKIYITGKGRCNITNACDAEEFFDMMISNKKFMYSPFYSMTNYQVMDLFEQTFGLKIKTERGNRVFPLSDKSSDVINSLIKAIKKQGVTVKLGVSVNELIIENDEIKGVKTDDGIYKADSVIVATGGLSYPSTGSTGDGYKFAKYAGHEVTKLMPALVPLETKEKWVTELQGLSLKNIKVSFTCDNKELYSDFGEMIFTHFGVSGPVILSASSLLTKRLHNNNVIKLSIDLKPALTLEQLDKRIMRDFEEQSNQQFKNSLGKLLPKKIIPVIISLTGINSKKQVNAITKEERMKLAKTLKNLECTITKPRGFNEAIITQGGINVKEINPATMESKICKGLYFAGEVLDVDAVTGGYNLQIAWSTGYLAGLSIQ